MEAPGDEAPRTMFEKIWSRHRVLEREDGQTLLYVDRHLLHDGGATAFDAAAQARPEAARAGPGLRHARPLRPHRQPQPRGDPRPAPPRHGGEARPQHRGEHGIRMFGLGDPNQGIVHVVGPETGPLASPACSWSAATATPPPTARWARSPSASAARRWRMCWPPRRLWQRKPKTMRITVDGTLGRRRDGQGRDPGHHRADRRRRRDRPCHRICRQRHPRPLHGRPPHPLQHVDRGRRPRRHGGAGRHHLRLSARPPLRAEGRGVGRGAWRAGAPCRAIPAPRFDREVALDAAAIAPMVTWGNSPEDALPITGRVPEPGRRAGRRAARGAWQRTLDYMGLTPGTPLDGDRRSTASSSAPAPTAASRTCARRRRRPGPQGGGGRARPGWCRAPGR